MSEKIQVAGVILHQDGKILLQHRDDKPTIYWPDTWAIFGGMVEPGETPEEAARREIEEELGLRLEGELLLVCRLKDQKRERFFYAAELRTPVETLVLTEGQGMALIAPEELDTYSVIPLHREILREWLKGQ